MKQKTKKIIMGEYTISDNPIDGRQVVVHYSDGSTEILHK